MSCCKLCSFSTKWILSLTLTPRILFISYIFSSNLGSRFMGWGKWVGMVISEFLSSNVEFHRNEQSNSGHNPGNLVPGRKLLNFHLCEGFKISFYFFILLLRWDSLVLNLRMRKGEECQAVDYYNDGESLVQKIISSDGSVTWNQFNFPKSYLWTGLSTFLLLVFFKNWMN